MKKTLLLPLGFVALLLGCASVAAACTAQASLGAVTPNEAPPGTVVTVTGSTFEDGPIEIRWGGKSGPVIGVAQGPNFSTTVTIPPAQPGVYYLAAVSYDEFGESTSRAKPFKVVAPEAEPRPIKPVDPEPAHQRPADQEPVDREPEGGAPADQRPLDRGPVHQPGTTDAVAPAAGPGPTPAQLDTVAPVDLPAGPTTVAEEEPAPTEPDPTPAGAEASVPPLPAPGATPAFPSAQTVSGDLWSGFAAGPDAVAPASLTDDPSTPGRPGPTFLAGIALLATGLAALFAGAVAAMTAQRRRAAHGGPPRP